MVERGSPSLFFRLTNLAGLKSSAYSRAEVGKKCCHCSIFFSIKAIDWKLLRVSCVISAWLKVLWIFIQRILLTVYMAFGDIVWKLYNNDCIISNKYNIDSSNCMYLLTHSYQLNLLIYLSISLFLSSSPTLSLYLPPTPSLSPSPYIQTHI